MQRPSFQFYPGDWRANSNLRRCSWAARGVWIEVMGLMHDADEYGVLRWSLNEVAQALGCPLKLLQELTRKAVLKGADTGRCPPYVYTPRSGGRDCGPPVTLVAAQAGPVWYSTRMVRDEHVRKRRGDASRFTSEPAPKTGPKPPFEHGSSSSSSSSSSEKTSVPFGDGAQEDDLRATVFKLGRQLLTEAGSTDRAAGSLIGQLRKAHGDQAVLEALEAAQRERVSDPAAWLRKTCGSKPRRRALEIGAQDYDAGWADSKVAA